jgi:dihydropteroate synthase
MGVVNVTPDSFSDGGEWFGAEAAIGRGRQLAAQGADIVDVGGESTRPGAQRIPADEELRRVIPVITGLASENVPVSVDTMRAEVAAAALDAGASLVNDVSGGLADPDMPRLVAQAGVPYVVMHWRGHSHQMQERAIYADVVGEVCEELRHRVDAVIAQGVDPSMIVVDPGLGFAKQPGHNWALLVNLDRLSCLDGTGHAFPVLVGASRKRFLGRLLASPDGTPRSFAGSDDATVAVTALAAAAGAWCARVHEVPANSDAVRVAEAWRTAAAAGEASMTELDRIELRGLRVFARHGVLDSERQSEQEFVIDAVLWLDTRPAAGSDDLSKTVDYGALADRLVRLAEEPPVRLIETLAERLAADCLSEPLVAEVEITVHKPQAPIAHPFSDVTVVIRRARLSPGLLQPAPPPPGPRRPT